MNPVHDVRSRSGRTLPVECIGRRVYFWFRSCRICGMTGQVRTTAFGYVRCLSCGGKGENLVQVERSK